MPPIAATQLAGLAEGAGRDTSLPKSHDFCGFSILAVRLIEVDPENETVG